MGQLCELYEAGFYFQINCSFTETYNFMGVPLILQKHLYCSNNDRHIEDIRAFNNMIRGQSKMHDDCKQHKDSTEKEQYERGYYSHFATFFRNKELGIM